MTKPTHSTLWILLALLLAAGCTSMGTGYGTTAAGTNPVRFDWKSSDYVSGTMYATLADGSVYAGSYFQITDTTTADTLGPLWDGWGSGWGFGGWDYWDTGTVFVTHYSGLVVADLADPRLLDRQHGYGAQSEQPENIQNGLQCDSISLSCVYDMSTIWRT